MKKIFKNILILKLIITIVLINFSLITPTALFAAFNSQINYQGRLLDNVGDPVANADYNIQFTLYTVSSGGSPVWTETHCFSPDSGATCDGTGVDQRIETIDGLFSVMLGSISSLDSVNFNQTLYLGVNIGGSASTPGYDGEMTPRKVLGAVPAAFESGKLDGVSSEQFLRNDVVNSTSSATTSLSIIQNGAGKIAEFFSSGYTSVMSILSSGNVGIGTTTPYAKFSVAGDVAITGGIYDNNATRGTDGYVLQTTGTGIAWVATSTLGISGGGGMAIGDPVTSGTASSVLFVDSSGNLAQDNSAFYFDTTRNYLNLGTSLDALVIGDITGNTRGDDAVDIQSLRDSVSQVASGYRSVALGSLNTASGASSVSVGYSNTASGDYSSAFGYNTQATAVGASVFGGGGNGSGVSMINSVANSTLIGPGATTSIHILGTGEVKMPYFTATSTTATSTIAGNLKVANNLQVGNGTLNIDTDSITSSGALSFNVNGTLFNLPTSQGGAGYVLKNDGSGNLSWVATSTLGITAPGSDSYTNVLSNTWFNSTKTIPASLYLSQTAVIGDYVYLFGGGNASAAVNTIYRAPVSDPTTWSNTGSTLPSALYGGQIAIIGDYVYIFGGYNGSYTNTIYRAPVSNPTSWTNTGSTLPTAMYSSTLAVVGDYVYLFGGYNGSSYTNVIYRATVADPTTWTNTGSTIPGALNTSQAVVIGDYIYLFGGYNGSAYTNIIYRAPTSNPTSWTNTGATLPTTIAATAIVVVGDYVYILGGIQGGGYAGYIYRASVASPTVWTYAGTTIPASNAYSAATIIGDYLYLFGGHNVSSPVNAIYHTAITSRISTDATVTTHGGMVTAQSWKYLPNGTNSTSGGVSTFQELTDTQNDLNANRIVYTNSGGTALTDTANFVFNGTNFGVGTSTPSGGISLGQATNNSAGGLWISATDGDYRSIYMGTDQVMNFAGGSGNTATLNALGAWTNASDAAYKENIAELEYGLAEIMQINARRYTWRSNGISDIGFIAQELEEIIPEVVFGEEGSKTISYGQLGALTVRGLQEIGSRIDLLSAPTSTPSIKLDETGGLIVNNNLSVQNNAIFEKSLTVIGTTTSSFGGPLSIQSSMTIGETGISTINPFSINDSQFHVATSGAVGIGTTTPARKLHVVREGEGSPVRFQDSNGYCEIDPTSTSWTCTSDERLKENISALENEEISEKIRQLRPVTFEWKTDLSNAERIGFIAQEVEVVFPEFVNTDETTGLKSVAYGAFVPYIVATLQDLAGKIDALTTAVEELTNGSMDSISGVIRKLTIGTSEKPVGVTLFDEATGDPYCLSIRNSNVVTQFGECNAEGEDETSYVTDIEEVDEPVIDFDLSSPIEEIIDEAPEEILEEVVEEVVETVVEEEPVEEIVEEVVEEIVEEIVEESAPEVFIETNSSSGGGGLNII